MLYGITTIEYAFCEIKYYYINIYMDWSSNFLSIILLIILMFVLSNMYADFSDQFVSIDSDTIRRSIKKFFLK